MDPSLSFVAVEIAPPALITGLPTNPAPGAFWAVLTWIIIPGTLMIWIAYHSRRERLRSVHRKLRQLEIRLASATPAKSAASAALPRPAPSARPSSLTARILPPASGQTSAIPVFNPHMPGHTV